MVKAVIYMDEKSSLVFCPDGKVYFKNPVGGYIEARDILKSIKFVPKMSEKKQMLEKMLSMDYKKAAEFHLKNQKSKGRKGKLFEGEFNDK
jgi:hypothetical protein